MIPKIIHYCWLSGDILPAAFQKNLDHWKELLPDYEFMLWDFNRFKPQEHDCGRWVKECFFRKRYAWASDPIRLTALYQYGGIYMDLDVELVKPFNTLHQSSYMLGFEYTGYIEAGIMGAEPGMKWVKNALDQYAHIGCLNDEGGFDSTPLPVKIFNSLKRNGISLQPRKDDSRIQNDDVSHRMYILDPIYLSAKDNNGVFANEKTYCIHHFAASSAKMKWKIKMYIINNVLGQRFAKFLVMIKHRLIK